MSDYRFLFFDIDHTLWDFESNSVETLRDLYHETGLPALGVQDFDDFNRVYHAINDRLWDRFRKGYLSRQELRWKRMWQTLVHYRIPDEALAKKMSERYLEILPTKTALFPHAEEALEHCRLAGYEMHLITNGFELTQQQKLLNAGIHHFFGKMITSEQAMSMKPHREIFVYALEQTGADARSSVMIGDALEIDILGGQQAGMDQVYFNPARKPHDWKPTYEISCWSELKRLF